VNLEIGISCRHWKGGARLEIADVGNLQSRRKREVFRRLMKLPFPAFLLFVSPMVCSISKKKTAFPIGISLCEDLGMLELKFTCFSVTLKTQCVGLSRPPFSFKSRFAATPKCKLPGFLNEQ
jgi:hypothetical protein